MANFQVFDAYGSVITIQSSTFSGEQRQIVAACIIGGVPTIPSGNQSVSGTVGASIIGVVPFSPVGTIITSIVSTVPSSVIVGASIFGQLPGGTAVLGSVAVLQGTNPWAHTNVGSVITTQVGSVIAVLQSPSIVGTYAEDTAHAVADKGVFVLGVRNDAITSIVGTDRDYAPIAVDEASRVIVVPFAGTKASLISYVGSVVSGSVTLIQPSVIGSKSYVTDFWFSNTGATTVLATIQDGTTSVMGQFIVPAGGGMASPGIAIPLKPIVAAGSDIAWKVSPSSSVVYLTLKGYQAP